jgi:hypothetical protein
MHVVYNKTLERSISWKAISLAHVLTMQHYMTIGKVTSHRKFAIVSHI